MLCDLIYLQHAAADRARRFRDEAERRRLALAAPPPPPGRLRRRLAPPGRLRRRLAPRAGDPGTVAGEARARPESAGAPG